MKQYHPFPDDTNCKFIIAFCCDSHTYTQTQLSDHQAHTRAIYPLRFFVSIRFAPLTIKLADFPEHGSEHNDRNVFQPLTPLDKQHPVATHCHLNTPPHPDAYHGYCFSNAAQSNPDTRMVFPGRRPPPSTTTVLRCSRTATPSLMMIPRCPRTAAVASATSQPP